MKRAFEDPLFIAANRAQAAASDPHATRLTSANAGSGKTRVLVERVSRILLTDTPPEKILCLTYTKAAASEMQRRLFEKLGAWSIMPEVDLRKTLDGLLEGHEGDISLKNARALFAKALETPEGLKVQTIHAFCERILSRFPIEAGILPGYETLDDSDGAALRLAITEHVLKDATKALDGPLNHALQHLGTEMAGLTLDEHFTWMAYNGDNIRRWRQAGGVETLAKILDIPLGLTPNDIKLALWEATDKDALRRHGAALLESSSKGDIVTGQTLINACNTPQAIAAFDGYLSVFLTQKQQPRKKIVTRQASEPVQAFFRADGPETARMIAAAEQIKGARCLSLSHSLFTLASHYENLFTRAKHIQRKLDFNDQITLVRRLLNNSAAADWVRYKLDGGIDHILLDEAQDTSPSQWDIIDALAAPFFDGSDHERNPKQPRTLFAVGDEKQSIYSFQGAMPEQFLGKIQHYTQADAAQNIRMTMSFRSAPKILETVDQIFIKDKAMLEMFDADVFPPASDLVGHTAYWQDAGQVELWPLAPRPTSRDDKEAWDTTPLDMDSESSARETLAKAIARQIHDWLKNRAPVYDRKNDVTRPMQARDILILVQSRNPFFGAVIRNLKSVGVAVAGADRLTLKDSIAIKDLFSLARFVLLPSDDLSLAETLKTPLFNWDDEQLMSVAIARDNMTLWGALARRAPKTHAALTEIISYARQYPPYEFFARVLNALTEDGESYRQKIFRRLGQEMRDPLDAFLAQALAHQRKGAPSLQHFIDSFELDDTELKREIDGTANEVRVMTVHGAKGLEAPVVFLPDTTQRKNRSPAILPVSTKPGALDQSEEITFALTSGGKAQLPHALTPYKDRLQSRSNEEYLRLLYVAMTRAESRLILCGYALGSSKTGYAKDSWYERFKTAFDGLDSRPLDTEFGGGQVFGRGLQDTVQAHNIAPSTAHTLPSWITQPAPPEPKHRARVSPSHLLAPPPGFDNPVPSPGSGHPDRFLRGQLTHKLLEFLPDLPIAMRETAAENFMAAQKIIDKAQKDSILTDVFAVLDAPDYAHIFAAGSRAEISLAGRARNLPKGLYLNGQIDRLAVTVDHVYIIDYKSNRPPPKTQDGVAELYWGQMAAYRELAREIYPDREITCALLWTDGPSLMVLDAQRLDHTLTQIAKLPTSITG